MQNTPLMPRIAIYADLESHVSSAPLDQEIRRNFPGAVIEKVTRHDLLNESLYDDLSALVIPGIKGEDSLYPLHIGPANDLIRKYIRAGGIYMGQCAGAYYAARAIRYEPAWGNHKREDKNLLGLFNGIAVGPPPGLRFGKDDWNVFHGLTTTGVITDAMEEQVVFPLVYSSGPTFMAREQGKQDIRVHARYADAEGQPPAIISFHYGRGLVILTGPLPQYHGYPPTGLPHYEKLESILALMLEHESERRRMFDSLMSMVGHHARKTGFLPA